ncbi:hypothetical protein RJ641_025178 [Dillenia turbinata]|uniref:F-box domain-containing protein n=1 Tax=Dillenia turbinata TaxID=194707 RepID=A0AAN8W8X1_9MAGN
MEFPPPHTADVEAGSTVTNAATIGNFHPDIVRSHILTRLDGPTLASTSCASRDLHSLSSDSSLWTNVCHSTWPSTNTPRLHHVISQFSPDGPRSFFSRAHFTARENSHQSSQISPPSELISAVDLRYGNTLILSKFHTQETLSNWFNCSPFRVDLLNPKDVVTTQIPHSTCQNLEEKLTLSWILIDPIGRRAMNVSSHKPVSVKRHWLSGEIQIRFATVLSGERNKSSPCELVQCGVVITCGGAQEGERLQVKEVSLQVENLDGTHLSGMDSLVILERAMEGRMGNEGKMREIGKRYEEFLEMKRERRERMLRREGRLDMLCVALGVTIMTVFCFFIFLR